MLSHVVYGCQCLNIKIHLSTKYSLNDHINERKKTVVQEPEPGWEFELGMGGIIIEYRSLIQTFYGHAGWVTVKCLNCGMGSVYSIKRTENNMENIQDTDRIVIHNNSIFGSEMDSIRKSAGYSKTFNIVLLQDSKNTIPLPESTDVLSTDLKEAYGHMQSVLDLSLEKLRLESKLRVEQFKMEEEKRLTESMDQVKMENRILWTKVVELSKEPEKTESSDEIAEDVIVKKNTKPNHVRFQSIEHVANSPRTKGFHLDENAIMSLSNKNLDSQVKIYADDSEDEDEEEMFHLDEEMSEEDREELSHDEDMVSEGEIEEKMDDIGIVDSKPGTSWMRRKRNMDKYLVHDFHIKKESRDNVDTDGNEPTVTQYATSVPVSIQYRLADTNIEKSADTKQESILSKSFANYDFSYSDRLISEQLPSNPPPPRRRRSMANSLISPQLEAFVGRSLDTRGIMNRKTHKPLKQEELENEEDDDEFDSKRVPNVWAAIQSIKEEEDAL